MRASSGHARWLRIALLGSVAAGFAVGAAGGAFEVVAHETPARLPARETVDVRVALRNLEAEPWGGGDAWAVSYHWLNRDGQVVTWDGVRTPLPGIVAPQQTVTVSARVETPEAGEFLLVWDVVHEGVRWLGDGQGEPLRVPVEVRASHAFTVVAGRAPRVVTAGSASRVRLAVRNDGLGAWPDDGRVAVSYHWRSADGPVVEWEGARTALPRKVPPDGSVDLEVEVISPGAPGRYLLEWDMVDEGVCWFSERDPSSTETAGVLVVPVVPVAAAGWLGLLAVGCGAAVLARRRGWTGSVPGADVLWALVTLVCAQAVVLGEIGDAIAPAGVGAAAAGAALLLLPSLAIRPTRRRWVVVAVVVAALSILHADQLYLRFFGDLLSLAAIRAAGQVDEVRASVAGLFSWRDIWLWAPVAALPCVLRLGAADADGRRSRSRTARGLGVVAACAAVAALSAAVRHADTSGQVFRQVYLAREVGVLNLHVYDLVTTAKRSLSQRALDPGERQRVTSWFEARRSQRAAVGEWAGAARGRNLILIQVESLQSFVLDMTADGEPVMPLLDSWRRDALWFSNVTDQTEQGRSSDAELATQTSLLPLSTGAAVFPYGDNHFSGLAEILGDMGYHTLSAVPFESGFWNRRVTHRAFGYAERLFVDAFQPAESIGWGLNDRDFLDQMADRLERAPKPFAAWLITLSLHHPYDGFPAHLATVEVGDLAGTPMGNYLQTMRFFDRALAAFVDRLAAAGLLDSSLLVVWGDHDAGFEWSRATAAALGARPDAVGWYLSQQVPLFVRAPGLTDLAGERILPAGHVDVAPTVLALLGGDPAAKAFIGRNLLGEPGDEPVVGEYRCWRTSTRLFLQGGSRLEDGRCFELPSLAPLPSRSCGEAFAVAAEQGRTSDTVLRHDLQAEISARLDAVPGSG